MKVVCVTTFERFKRVYVYKLVLQHTSNRVLVKKSCIMARRKVSIAYSRKRGPLCKKTKHADSTSR